MRKVCGARPLFKSSTGVEVGHGVDIVWSMKFLCSAGTNGGAEQFVEQGFCNVIKDLQCFVPLFHKISHRGGGKAKEVKSFKLFSE
jgi:hypothetical protein